MKILPQFYTAVEDGRKTFELRKADRSFAVGDSLVLCEWDGKAYTGRELRVDIGYILGGYDGLVPGYVILGLVPNH